jgi:hypothetical protein
MSALELVNVIFEDTIGNKSGKTADERTIKQQILKNVTNICGSIEQVWMSASLYYCVIVLVNC